MLKKITNLSTSEKVMLAVSPAAFFLSKGAEAAAKRIEELRSRGTIEELQQECPREELIAKMELARAKVEQELAIAHRIKTAEIVEIEEVYEASGKGGVNFQATEGNLGGGVSGEGRKMTKRIYRFTGWNEGAARNLEEEYEQNNEE